MQCSECTGTAVARVRVNGVASLVCEPHRVAIVRRIEQVVQRCGHTPNLREIAVLALDNIEFEDL